MKSPGSSVFSRCSPFPLDACMACEGDSSRPAFDMVCFELGASPFPLEINVSKVGELVARSTSPDRICSAPGPFACGGVEGAGSSGPRALRSLLSLASLLAASVLSEIKSLFATPLPFKALPIELCGLCSLPRVMVCGCLLFPTLMDLT